MVGSGKGRWTDENPARSRLIEEISLQIDRVLTVAGEEEKREFSYMLSKKAYHSLTSRQYWGGDDSLKSLQNLFLRDKRNAKDAISHRMIIRNKIWMRRRKTIRTSHELIRQWDTKKREIRNLLRRVELFNMTRYLPTFRLKGVGEPIQARSFSRTFISIRPCICRNNWIFLENTLSKWTNQWLSTSTYQFLNFQKRNSLDGGNGRSRWIFGASFRGSVTQVSSLNRTGVDSEASVLQSSIISLLLCVQYTFFHQQPALATSEACKEKKEVWSSRCWRKECPS